MDDQRPKFPSGKRASMVQFAVSKNSTAHSGSVSQADKITFPPACAKMCLPDGSSVYVIFHIDRNMECLFHDGSDGSSRIAGNVVVGVYDAAFFRVHLSCSADPDSGKIPVLFIRSNNLFGKCHNMLSSKRSLGRGLTDITENSVFGNCRFDGGSANVKNHGFHNRIPHFFFILKARICILPPDRMPGKKLLLPGNLPFHVNYNYNKRLFHLQPLLL